MTDLEAAIPAVRARRLVLILIGVVTAVAMIAIAIWWIFLHPAELQRQVAQAGVDAKLGTAAGDISAAAIPDLTEANRQRVQVDVAVQKGTIDVRSQSDAATSIAGVSAAARRADCMHADLYAADGACAAVHEDPAGVGTVGADAGSTAQPD